MAMMISKFHKLVASKRVWGAFAVLISVAFVLMYTNGKYGRQSRAAQKAQIAGKLFGKEISRDEFAQAYEYSHLLLIMRNGGKPFQVNENTDQLIRRTAWQRLAILDKAHQMGLTVSSQQIVTAIQQQPIFANRQTKMFDRNIYNAFITRYLPQLGIRMSEKSFENMMRENALIGMASSMARQSALVTDEELNHAFHVYSDKLTVEYATIPRSLVTAPKITVDDAKKYYASNTNQFVCPEKVRVHYVAYPVADYTNQIQVTDQMVTNVYQNNKQLFVKQGTENSDQPQYESLADSKDKIVGMITEELAKRKATSDAGAFVSKLSRGQSLTFDQLAKQMGKTVESTPPFAQTDDIKDIDPTAKFAQTAFTLQKDSRIHYYSDPVVGTKCVYVISIQDRYPSFLPDYDVIAGEVMKAAKTDADDKAYIDKAKAVHADIESALKSGTAFDAAATKEGLKVTTTKTFSVSDPLSDDLGRKIMQATALFDSGTLVDLIPNGNDLLVAYVASKVPADKSKADPDLLSELKTSIQRDKADRLTSAWQQSVMDAAHVDDYDAAKKAADNNS